MADDGEKAGGPIFIDIRRYYCEYCGICRSKKSLLTRHILTEHEEELKEKSGDEEEEHGEKLNICNECGASFRKPAHLKQHMQSHSLERPFACPIDDCNSSYRRKDHLTRHMFQHEGKIFECSIGDCKLRFSYQSNMTRHVKEFHEEPVPHDVETQKEHVCREHDCGKTFKYPSRLLKHESSHVKLDSVEALCGQPGCMKYFSNVQCLKEHTRTCHQYTICHKCGQKQLKKNMKRHMRMHESEVSSQKIKCIFEECSLTFSNNSNLKTHIKAVHLEMKPYVCSMPGCDMKFSFKHVRDKHEMSGYHVYTHGDFEETDVQFRSRPRGGQKRKFPVIERLFRKRVIPPSESELGYDLH